MPWGTPVRIDLTREKITLPTPKCSLIVVPKVFRSTATILAWLRTKSLRATKNKRLFIFAESEMLSRNDRPFLEIRAKPKKTENCLYFRLRIDYVQSLPFIRYAAKIQSHTVCSRRLNFKQNSYTSLRTLSEPV